MTRIEAARRGEVSDEVREVARSEGLQPEDLGRLLASGEAVITPAFGIRTARSIIHAVGPVYSAYPADKARELLRSAYRAAIRLAVAQGCRSIAFPAISTGIYGYPLDEACREAADVCSTEAAAQGVTIKLVAFDAETAAELRKHLQPAGR